jgi:hypothetical protein
VKTKARNSAKTPDSSGFHGIIETAPKSACNTRQGLTRSTGTSSEGLPDMVPKLCSKDACEQPHKARGFCNTHYAQWLRVTPTADRSPRPTIEERFWAKVDKSGECWLWTASTYTDGYGCFRRVHEFAEPAHRWAFKSSGQDIPDGYHVDHICFNRTCVNPAHLRLATAKQNNENRNGANSNNRSCGIQGVTRSGSGWSARVNHNKRDYYLGTFRTAEEAGRAAANKRLELFTHNHLDRMAGA